MIKGTASQPPHEAGDFWAYDLGVADLVSGSGDGFACTIDEVVGGGVFGAVNAELNGDHVLFLVDGGRRS